MQIKRPCSTITIVLLQASEFLQWLLSDTGIHRRHLAVLSHSFTGQYYVRDNNFVPSGRNSPLGEMCRYRVCRVMPSSWHRSPTFVSGWSSPAHLKPRVSVAWQTSSLRATSPIGMPNCVTWRCPSRISLMSRSRGLPTLAPRCFAAASPSTVFSRITSRWNSAKAAKR